MEKLWNKLEEFLIKFYNQPNFDRLVLRYLGKGLLVLMPTLFLGPTLVVVIGLLPVWVSLFALFSYSKYKENASDVSIAILCLTLAACIVLCGVILVHYLRDLLELLMAFNVFSGYSLQPLCT